MRSKTLYILIILSVVAGMFGCTKETDPHQKYDVPGYYNGPMKPHGGASGTQNAPGAKAAPGTE